MASPLVEQRKALYEQLKTQGFYLDLFNPDNDDPMEEKILTMFQTVDYYIVLFEPERPRIIIVNILNKMKALRTELLDIINTLDYDNIPRLTALNDALQDWVNS